MKKLLILTATLMTGGFALPAAAQGRAYSTPVNTVFVSGHLRCGTPIYSKRVRQGRHYAIQRLSGYELRRYLERQRRINAQRDLQRRIARDRSIRSRQISGSQRRHR